MCNLRVKKLINIITFTFYCSEVFPHVTNKKRTAGNAAREKVNQHNYFYLLLFWSISPCDEQETYSR
jgi:hypothetical protein